MIDSSGTTERCIIVEKSAKADIDLSYPPGYYEACFYYDYRDGLKTTLVISACCDAVKECFDILFTSRDKIWYVI